MFQTCSVFRGFLSLQSNLQSLFRRHKRHLWRVSQHSPPDRMRSSEQSCCSPHWNKSALDASLVRWGILWTCLTRTPQISLEVLSDPPLELEGLAWMRSELLCDLETWMNTELFPWWESDCRQPASQSQYFNSKAFYKAAQVHIMVRATVHQCFKTWSSVSPDTSRKFP